MELEEVIAPSSLRELKDDTLLIDVFSANIKFIIKVSETTDI